MKRSLLAQGVFLLQELIAKLSPKLVAMR